MNFRLLEDFLALVDYGSFTRAAEVRNSTQSAFSRRIQNLEGWVGAPLFERDRGPVRLTREGELFKPCAEDLLRRLGQAREMVIREHSQRRRTVTISATHSLAASLLPLLLHRIEQAHPDLMVRLFSSDFDACLHALATGNAHFLLSYAHPQAPPDLPFDQLLSALVGGDTLVPVKAGRTRKGTLPPAGALLAYSQESGIGRILAAALGNTIRQRFTQVFESSYASVLKSMALEGCGTAWLPLRDIGAELQAGTLVRAHPEEWDVPLEIRLFRYRGDLAPHAEAAWGIASGMQ